MSVASIIAMLIVGLLLIVLEVLVIPGFGFAGILGLGALAVGAFAAWTEIGPLWGGIAAAGSVLASIALAVILPKTRFGRRMVLEDASTGHAERTGRAELIGTHAVTVTPLRPTGVARFEDSGEERDVTAATGLIDVDQRVRVVAVDGTRVLVEGVAGVGSADDEGQGAA